VVAVAVLVLQVLADGDSESAKDDSGTSEISEAAVLKTLMNSFTE
jgi:hypothetical protein